MKLKKVSSVLAISLPNLMKSRILNVVLVISLLMSTVIIASAAGDGDGDDTPTLAPGTRLPSE